MADEEEVEETEDEEEEPEEQPKKRRKGSKRAGMPTRGSGSLGGRAEGRLYHQDVPVGRNGVALEDVDMTVDQIQRIGGFDAESARINENSRRVMSRKARGESNVKFNSDARTKYHDIKNFRPFAWVALKQVYPVVDEKLRAVQFSACPTYDDLLRHVLDTYWKGDDAQYEWRAYDGSNSALGVGRFAFAADPNHVPGRHHEDPAPQQQPQQPPQQNPFGMWPGMTGMPGMPQWPMMGMQPQPQPAPVAAPPPGTDPMLAAVLQHNAQLMNMIMAAVGQNAQLQAAVQNMPAIIDQKVKEAAPPPAPPAAPPPPPPTPVEQIEQASHLVSAITRAGRVFATQLGVPGGAPPDEPPPATSDEDFPIQIRKVGPLNMAAQDGKLVDNLFLNAVLNAGNAMDVVKSVLDGLNKGKQQQTELDIKRIEAESKREEQKLTNLREAAKLKAQLEGRAPPLQVEPAPQPQNSGTWQAPPWSSDPPPAGPESTS